MWIVLLTEGYDMPEVFGPWTHLKDADRFAIEHEDAGAEVSWMFLPDDADKVLAERSREDENDG